MQGFLVTSAFRVHESHTVEGFVFALQGLCPSCLNFSFPLGKEERPGEKYHAYRPSKVFPEGRVGIVRSSSPCCLSLTSCWSCGMLCLALDGGSKGGSLLWAQHNESCKLNRLPKALLAAAQL